jgi:hypothetical protein
MSTSRHERTVVFEAVATALEAAFWFDLPATDGYLVHIRDGTDDGDERGILSITQSLRAGAQLARAGSHSHERHAPQTPSER